MHPLLFRKNKEGYMYNISFEQIISKKAGVSELNVNYINIAFIKCKICYDTFLNEVLRKI